MSDVALHTESDSRRNCKERTLTDIADADAAKMAKKGCIWYECGDEDKCQERSGPRRYATCANTCVCMSAEARVEKGVSGRTQSTDSL